MLLQRSPSFAKKPHFSRCWDRILQRFIKNGMSADALIAESSDPSRLAPEYVRSIARYIPGKPVEELAREFGLDPDRIVKLASNENPRGPGQLSEPPSPTPRKGCRAIPDGNGFALKTALAARFDVDADDIVLGNGSNDVLELVTQAFLRPGDTAVYSRHAFASIRWRPRRAARPVSRSRRGSTMARPRRDACRHRALDARRVRRQSEQSDRHLDSTGDAAAIHRVGARGRSRRVGRGI
jgi:hypothetical protein